MYIIFESVLMPFTQNNKLSKLFRACRSYSYQSWRVFETHVYIYIFYGILMNSPFVCSGVARIVSQVGHGVPVH